MVGCIWLLKSIGLQLRCDCNRTVVQHNSWRVFISFQRCAYLHQCI